MNASMSSGTEDGGSKSLALSIGGGGSISGSESASRTGSSSTSGSGAGSGSFTPSLSSRGIGTLLSSGTVDGGSNILDWPLGLGGAGASLSESSASNWSMSD